MNGDGPLGRVGQADLKASPGLSASDFIGKTGVEAFYDRTLRGTPGVSVEYRDAYGKVLRKEQQSTPAVGDALHLTIDGGLQSYLYSRLAGGLRSLGRKVGLALAIDPRNGEVLSLVNLPGFDNNVFSQTGTSTNAVIRGLLSSPDKPLFDRVVVLKPASMLIKVVFPAPLGPSKPKNSPCSISRLTRSTASILPPDRRAA